ncbi:MAG: hypothetical protein R2854_14045 [Caldilineaceae bacterium]
MPDPALVSQQRRHRRRGTLSLLVCSMAAYGFARLTFPESDALLFAALRAHDSRPGDAHSHLYLVRNLGWLDTYRA